MTIVKGTRVPNSNRGNIIMKYFSPHLLKFNVISFVMI